jgi:hypothetical protein
MCQQLPLLPLVLSVPVVLLVLVLVLVALAAVAGTGWLVLVQLLDSRVLAYCWY